jgi:hypothetical protein
LLVTITSIVGLSVLYLILGSLLARHYIRNEASRNLRGELSDQTADLCMAGVIAVMWPLLIAASLLIVVAYGVGRLLTIGQK